ncbi:MAG: ribonuclease HII [Candidatus Omnitrophica bacterium]|nr:ribonuclease HII [Candidatus Omnitrophota bacterium]
MIPDEKFFYEKKAFKEGYKITAGIDKAGKGPLAGPVIAAAVIVNDKEFIERVDDSKKLTEKMRKKAYLDIMKRCQVGIGSASVKEIDSVNIYQATMIAMKRAVEDLKNEPDFLLVDGNMKISFKQKYVSLTSGESKSFSIACASVIAKVYRDQLMTDLDKQYPVYGFAKHKGYGTAEHINAIKKYGLSEVHRHSFGPFGSKDKREFRG